MYQKIFILIGCCFLMGTASAEAKKKHESRAVCAGILLQPRLFVCGSLRPESCVETNRFRISPIDGFIAVEGEWHNLEIDIPGATDEPNVLLAAVGAPRELFSGLSATVFRFNLWAHRDLRRPTTIRILVKRAFIEIEYLGNHPTLTGCAPLQLFPLYPPAQVPVSLVERTG